MPSERWLFDSATSVPPGGVWNAVGSTYSLRNVSAITFTRTTSSPTPYQGAGCVKDPTGGSNNAELWNASNTARISGTVLYTDSYYFTGSSDYGAGVLGSTGNDIEVQYLWTNINNTVANKIEANYYDGFTGLSGLLGSAAVGQVPINQWVRVQSKFETWGIASLRLFLPGNINGTVPSYEITWNNPFAVTGTSYGQILGMGANANAAFDDCKVDTAGYPTRGNEQWLLNDTSVANGAYFTPVGLSDYKLLNEYGFTVSRTTSSPSPYEGAGCYASSGNYATLPIVNADNSAITDTGAKYADFYIYFNANPATAAHSAMGSGNGAAVEYGSVGVYPDGHVGLISYDGVAGTGSYGTSTAAGFITPGSWMRFQVKVGQKVVEEVKIYKGFNINGTSPDATLTGTKYSGTKDGMSFGQSPVGDYHWLDDIKFSNSAYPTRDAAAVAKLSVDMLTL